MKVKINTNSSRDTISYEEIMKQEGWYHAVNTDYNLLVLGGYQTKSLALAISRNSLMASRISENHAWARHKEFIKLDNFSIII